MRGWRDGENERGMKGKTFTADSFYMRYSEADQEEEIKATRRRKTSCNDFVPALVIQ